MDFETIPSKAFGPLGRPPDEELRFWRLIEEREDKDNRTSEVTLACGHTVVFVGGIPKTQEYALCAQCLRKMIEAEKKCPTNQTNS